MRILLFIDSNIKTIPYEVPLLQLQRKGHEIIFLSILENGAIHQEYQQYGIPVFSMGASEITLKHLPRYILFFIKFCAKQKINVVFAHLTIPSLISVLGQYFIKAKVVCFRHHFNFINLAQDFRHSVNRIEKVIDKVNAALAPKVVLPSSSLKYLIQKNEGVPPQKMEVIPYVYDWSGFLERSYGYTSAEVCQPRLRLLMISRLTQLKRPELALKLLYALRKRNIMSELTVVGTGNMEHELKAYSVSLGIADLVHFAGFQKDVVPYLTKAEVLIHPSLTEASSSVIKEAGVLGCPVIVCNGVGDFNDYIVNGINGWLVDADAFCEEAIAILLLADPEMRKQVGRELKKTILERFSLSEAVVHSYEALVN